MCDAAQLAPVLPHFRGLVDLTLDERNFMSLEDMCDLLAALQPDKMPALAHLHCRRSKVNH